MNVLNQRALDVNYNGFACFNDFEKAFYRVNHSNLIETLLKSDLDDRAIFPTSTGKKKFLEMLKMVHQRNSRFVRVFNKDV